MIAYLSPHETFQSHSSQRSQAWARATGLALAATGHVVLLVWLLSQTFRPTNLVDNTPTPEPMKWVTIDQTPAQPSPKLTAAPANGAHTSTMIVDRRLEAPLVRVAGVKSTGPVSVNPFVDPGVGATLTLSGPTIAHTLTNPDWISRPTSDQVDKAYPEGALREGIAGAATLTCQVTSAGAVVGCKVNVETPAGRGFGRAALGLTPYFRIRPGTDNGQPIEGASVLIPIRFQITG